ncbi:MAG: NUDIX hydrolase [Acidobacteria bacterium]|nr:NUDIX hydrolase [Acidobacteriota bacterium]
MRRWRTEEVDRIFEHPLLSLERRRLVAGDDRRQALIVDTPDWVNVIALTDAREVLLVRQWRYGIEDATLEIPGGVVEPGEGHRAAAERELLEETGYRAAAWSLLGESRPNPAIQTNRISTWLATDLERLGEPEGDGEEELEVIRAPLAEIPRRVLAGEITHSLVLAAFYLFEGARSPNASGD